jgi:hypothetical protein
MTMRRLPRELDAMSDAPASWDPYAPPQVPQVAAAGGALPPGLKAICIIAIILGVLGILISCGGVASMAIGPALQAAFGMPAQAGMDPELVRAQEDLQGQMAAIGKEYLPFTIGTVVVHLLAGFALLLGGILTLKISATGRSILLTGCVLAVLYELVNGVLNVVMQMRMAPIVERFMEQALQRGGQAQMPSAFGQFMLVIMFVTLGISLVSMLVKIGFYIFSVIYLKKPHVAARFAA